MQIRPQSEWTRRHRKVVGTIGILAATGLLVSLSSFTNQLFARTPAATAAPAAGESVVPRSSHGNRNDARAVLPDLGELPSLEGGVGWINSAPITRESLRGKVAMIEIWTFACINCLHALPHVKETAERYRERGLVTIGVHTPELPQERPRPNVEAAVKKLGVTFPVVLDNNWTIWNAFKNQYWPSVYLVDRKGRIRFHHDGEGQYSELDDAVALLLAERP